MQKSIRVRLLKKEYALRVEDQDESHTRAVAAYVDSKLQAFKDAHPEQSDTTTAIITALALAEELFTLQGQVTQQQQSLEVDLSELEQVLSEAIEQASTPALGLQENHENA